MKFYRGETVDFICEFDDSVSVADIDNMVLVIRNASNDDVIKEITDLTIDADTNSVIYEFTQTESLAFQPNSAINFELVILLGTERYTVCRTSAQVADTYYPEELTNS